MATFYPPLIINGESCGSIGMSSGSATVNNDLQFSNGDGVLLTHNSTSSITPSTVGWLYAETNMANGIDITSSEGTDNNDVVWFNFDSNNIKTNNVFVDFLTIRTGHRRAVTLHGGNMWYTVTQLSSGSVTISGFDSTWLSAARVFVNYKAYTGSGMEVLWVENKTSGSFTIKSSNSSSNDYVSVLVISQIGSYEGSPTGTSFTTNAWSANISGGTTTLSSGLSPTITTPYSNVNSIADCAILYSITVDGLNTGPTQTIQTANLDTNSFLFFCGDFTCTSEISYWIIGGA